MASDPYAFTRYLDSVQPPTPKPTFLPPDHIVGNSQYGGQFSTPTTSSSSSSSSSSTTTPAVDPTTLANDWYKAFFSQYGVPSDVQGNIISLLTKYASDPTMATALATQYLRGTDWYQTKFPGFNAGVQNGLFTDESGYLSYLNNINNIYNQYLGRHVSGDEINALLSEGVNPGIVANRFQGQAYIQANKPEIQYLAGAFGNGQLTPDQLTALGNEKAGIDTAQGQLQDKILQKAQQVLTKLQGGNLANPSLSLGNNGLTAPSLLGTKGAPDVAA